jgi:hypothetical protein
VVVATAVLLAMVTQWQKKRKEATTPCLEPATSRPVSLPSPTVTLSDSDLQTHDVALSHTYATATRNKVKKLTL